MGSNKFLYLSMLLAVIFTMTAAGLSDGSRYAACDMASPDFCLSSIGHQFEVSSAFENIPRSSILNKCDSGSAGLSKNNAKGHKFLKRTAAVFLLAKADNRRHTVEHSTHYPLSVGYDMHCIDFFSRLNV